MILSFKTKFIDPILDGTKIHTFRLDPHNRWKKGNSIQMATGVRTKKYNCFSEANCLSVQKVKMVNHPSSFIIIFDDAVIYHWKDVIQIAKNDGFENPYDFIDWFFPNNTYGEWQGKLVHWTSVFYDHHSPFKTV